MENQPNIEAGKDTGRMGVFLALSTVLTYFIQLPFPEMPQPVIGGIVVLIMAGLTYLDSYIHNNKNIKANGLTTF